eukprot:9939555-Ditylum_brightwellii.AAC.1
MQVHLTTVNCKGSLTAKEHISVIWLSFLFLLQTDGVSIDMKQNWATECISMLFMIMLELVVRLDWITSEPSEHSIALMHQMCREFTVNNLILLVQKLACFQAAVLDANLKIMHTTEASGYIATAYHDKCKKADTMFHSGPIQIKTDLA